MKNVLNSPQSGWDALKKGTYTKEYSRSFISRDTRTALQKAIDKYNPNVTVEQKKTTEEGDFEMNDGSGWEKFCLHRAEHLINKEAKYLELREFIKGEWLNYTKARTDMFYILTLGNRKPVTPAPIYVIPKNRNKYYKMIEEDRQQVVYEGDYNCFDIY